MALWLVLKDFNGAVPGASEFTAVAQILDDTLVNVPALQASGCPMLPWTGTPAQVAARNAFLARNPASGSPLPSENLLDLLITFGAFPSGGGGGLTLALVYQPGGVATANVFTSWPALMAVYGMLPNAEEPVTIAFDGRFNANQLPIPAGMWTFRSLTVFEAPIGGEADIILADGAVLKDLTHVIGSCTFITNSTQPVFDWTPVPGGAVIVFFDRGGTIKRNGAVSPPIVWKHDIAIDGALLLAFSIGGTLGDGLPVVEVQDPGTGGFSVVAVFLLEAGNLSSNAYISAPGANVAIITTIASSAASASDNQPGWLGVSPPQFDTSPTLIPGASVVYRPGAPSADIAKSVFSNFQDVVQSTNSLAGLHVPYTILVDLSVVGSPFTFPDIGSFTFGDGAIFAGVGGGGFPQILAFDGAFTTINGIRQIDSNLRFDSVGNKVPWISPTCPLDLTNGGGLDATGKAVIRVDTSFDISMFGRSAVLNSGSSPIAMSAVGNPIVRISAYDDALLGVDAISGGPGSTVQISKDSPAARVGNPLTTFTGTLDYLTMALYSSPLADFGAATLPAGAGVYFLSVDGSPPAAGVVDDPYVEGMQIGLALRILASVHLWAQIAGVGAVTLDVLVNGVPVPGLTGLVIPLAGLAAPFYGVYAFAQGVPPLQSGIPLNSSDQVSVRITSPGIALSPVNIHCRVEAN